MAFSSELIRRIEDGAYDSALIRLYGRCELPRQRERYTHALRCFAEYYGPNRQVRIFSVPGRTELGGNHTDHQNGLALAAAVNLDIIAVASPSDDGLIRVKSYGFDKLDVIDLTHRGPRAGESTHSASLIRGIADEMERRGGRVGGFDAYTASDVLRGSGLSSSAAFEVAMGTVLNGLYNGGRFSPLEIAQIGQYAENTYFGKPSGLLDPLCCAMGGMLCADFAQPDAPVIDRLTLDLAPFGYALCVTDTKGSHSELTPAFAAVRQEMESVANQFGRAVLRDVPEKDVLLSLASLRQSCGDRAVLRALHFYAECRRVRQEYACLEKKDFDGFLALVAESGHSAFEYNQNAFCTETPRCQPIPIALALSQAILHGRGAWRLQGSGFAGTIQAFVPQDLLESYRDAMEQVFGPGSCLVLTVRAEGGIELTENPAPGQAARRAAQPERSHVHVGV